MTSKKTLKKWFSNFMKPAQEHFYAWIDSFWHKDEKIPMDSIEGLERIVEGTASAGQLLNHLSDTNAHRALFDKKVDKEEGKGLSSNDYTDEEKRTNETNAKKRVVGITVTGDVTKTLTITLADGETMQATFDDKDTLPENVADIKLNSLMFDKGTGVLTGQRSDGTPLTVNLDGRYALIDHTHSWGDIKNKPRVETRRDKDTVIYGIEGIGEISVPDSEKLVEKVKSEIPEGITPELKEYLEKLKKLILFDSMGKAIFSCDKRMDFYSEGEKVMSIDGTFGLIPEKDVLWSNLPEDKRPAYEINRRKGVEYIQKQIDEINTTTFSNLSSEISGLREQIEQLKLRVGMY